MTCTAASTSRGSTAKRSPRAFDHALLTGQGPVVRLRCRLAAVGREDQAQGVCQGIVAHLYYLGYFLADHRMICFGSNSCNAFARRGGYISGNVVPEAVPHIHNEQVVSSRRPGWRAGLPQRARRTS